jgi:two-component system sensor histidine kinase QseC
MLARIGRALAQEKRFTADAAHELRTPIAALRAQAQVALASTDARERRAALDATVAACDRVARLLEQLLTLARLDARDAAAFAGSADLDALARAVMAQLAGDAMERGDDLELRSTGPATITGEPTLLEVLLRNLIDNALRYSPLGAPVLVNVDTGSGAPSLSVENGGPGLDGAAMARLGERFYRATPDGPPGTGLGWSIVRRIAALHGARIEVDRSPALGGLRVRLQFLPRHSMPEFRKQGTFV